MDIKEYWIEAVSSSFEDKGISCDDKLIKNIAEDMMLSSENMSMAFGWDVIPNPLETENKSLQADLKREKEKIICETCKGKGSLRSDGPCHFSVSQCWKCNGAGFVYLSYNS